MSELPLLALPGEEEEDRDGDGDKDKDEDGDEVCEEGERGKQPPIAEGEKATATEVTTEDLVHIRDALSQMSAEARAEAAAKRTTEEKDMGKGKGTSAALRRAKKAANVIVRCVNALPFFSYEVARRAGVPENVARSALVFATVGDYFIPVVFSAAVVIASTIKRPMAPVETVRDLLESIRSHVKDISEVTGATATEPDPNAAATAETTTTDGAPKEVTPLSAAGSTTEQPPNETQSKSTAEEEPIVEDWY